MKIGLQAGGCSARHNINGVRMRIELQAGGCSARHNCKNNNKPCCDAVPKPGDNFVECDNYKKRGD